MQMYKKYFNSLQKSQTFHRVVVVFFMVLLYVVPLEAQENQAVRVTVKKPTVAQLFEQIEGQTGLKLTYDQYLDISKRVDVPLGTMPLSDLLNAVVKDCNRNYSITGSFIVIHPPHKEVREEPKESLVVVERINVATQRVEGEVVSVATGIKVAGATVEAVGRESYRSVTNSQGNFIFDALPIGEYRFIVIHPDFSALELQGTVSKDKLAHLVFALQSKRVKSEQNILYGGASLPDIELSRYREELNYGVNHKLPIVAIKTNLLSWATTSLSLGMEFRLSKRLTLDVPLSANPWTFNNNKKLRHFMVKPELRIWGHEAFNRHFFGLHLLYAAYNVGNIDLPLGIWDKLKDNRYEGQLYGAGLSVGNQWIIGKRWNLEATIGVGYFYTSYTQKECKTCGDFVKRGNKHYVGPTKLGLSFVYFIK